VLPEAIRRNWGLSKFGLAGGYRDCLLDIGILSHCAGPGRLPPEAGAKLSSERSCQPPSRLRLGEIPLGSMVHAPSQETQPVGVTWSSAKHPARTLPWHTKSTTSVIFSIADSPSRYLRPSLDALHGHQEASGVTDGPPARPEAHASTSPERGCGGRFSPSPLRQ